jgi:hypothetical protein
MATIKRAGNRIITKVVNGQRRVSCSCCEGEPFCCMYPADELGNLYGADDLPDAVTVNWTNRFTGSMSKSGSGYEGEGATLQIVNGIWQLSDSDGTRNVGRCLIRGDGNLTQGDDLVEDQFADELNYTLSGYTTYSGVFTRTSLCQWEDLETINDWFGFGSEFAGNFLNYSQAQNRFLATANVAEGYPKQDPSNTPLGTYVFDLGGGLETTMTVS